MVLVGLALAAAVQQSLWLAGVFLVTGVVCLVYWQQWSLASGVTILFVMGTLFTLFGPVVYDVRTPGRRSTCQNNLRQIALALQEYHDMYGSFPPAYIADKSGRPMHSWRVLILPYMEQRPLYNLYRFDEPWNGPNNRKLAHKIVRVYSCPDEKWKYSSEASYLAILGPHTAWPGEKPRSLKEFADGTSNVLLVVEVHNSGIHWMEPRDLHVTQMAPTINPPAGQGISSHHTHGANAAFADGHTRYLKDHIPADVLRSWIYLDDGTLREPPP
jgi:prepilin-type processing-associated H-X9-DG protein